MARPVRNRRRAKRRPATAPKQIDLDIVALGVRGDGVARRDAAEIHVPYTLPGERVRARVAGARGVVEEILTPSRGRVAPPCRHFGACGGCALQHFERKHYLEWKRQVVVDALARASLRNAPVGPVTPIPAATRRRATFAIKRSGADVDLGFNARASHRIVSISACEILHPELFAAAPALKSFAMTLPAEWRAFDMSVTLCENGVDVDLELPRGATEPSAADLTLLGDAMRAAQIIRLSIGGDSLLSLVQPIVRFAGVPVTPPPGGFLQASVEGERALVDLVRRAAGGARRALDLFCGAGAFSLPLSRTATVRAIDSDRKAVAALDIAARQSPYRPVTTETRNLFERPVMADELMDCDLALFDPPRAGAMAQAGELARSRVPLIVGVSCNPVTFARDAAILSQGGFSLVEVTPVDQFVYSPHVELVGVFRRT